jgi:hypothetical protein
MSTSTATVLLERSVGKNTAAAYSITFLGLPPFMPFKRAVDAFKSVVAHPPLRPISDKNFLTESGTLLFIEVIFSVLLFLVTSPVDIVVVVLPLSFPSVGTRFVTFSIP